jgi:tRNA-dihydrouridine synthase B
MLGNPWLIGTILDECQGKRKINISNEDKLGVIEEHLHLLIQEKGEYTGIREMRKHICWYLKNLKNSSKVKDYINSLETFEEVKKCLEEYFKTI